MGRFLNDLQGVLAVDKPADWTSHDVVAKLRGHFQIRKIGHAGTLDPMATGLLAILCGRGTKLSDYLMGAPKTYFMTARFGLRTDTQDITGTVLEERPLPAGLSAAAVEEALGAFRGEIMQLPPMYSAVKVKGQRLYKAARRGDEVEREPRKITVYDFRLLDFRGGEADFECRCSKGTYVRTLANDLGERLGCGAALTALRRTEGGGLTIAEAAPLEEVLAWDLEKLQERLAATYARIAPKPLEGAL